jgi:Cu2+-exporting ATPase
LTRRTPTQRIADRVVGIFVPIVLSLGGLTALYWVRWLPFDRALLIALAVLVVACPCAVGLAAPLATSLGIGRLARRGCLVRDSGALEELARTRLLAFDKTGTLTWGKAHVVRIETDGVAADEVLARAAGLERHSEHGFGHAITTAAAVRRLHPVVAGEVRILPGRGIRGNADGQDVVAGTGAMMSELGWSVAPALGEHGRLLEANGYSVIYVGWGEQVRAALAIDDSALPEARSTVEALRGRGLHVMLLSGDLAYATQRVAVAAGIQDVQSGLSPEAKRAALRQLRQRYDVVAMVGDGLNDGPVLAEADIGIAVGSATDLARETAALVLPRGGLWMLPWVVDVARAVRMTILTNLLWAFGYNLIALTLAALGLLQPVLAAAVMAGSSVLVVLNSLRLERMPDPVRMPLSGGQPSGEAQAAPATFSVTAEPAIKHG